MERNEHWDFVRGFSMLSMFLLNAAGTAQTDFGAGNLVHDCMALVEPIIFLSGFLICLRTGAIIQSGKYPTREVMKKFALRRIVRTWPLYWIVIIACFAFPQISDRPLQKSLFSFLTFTMNLDVSVFSGGVGMWTLCIEEWCYAAFLLIIPFLADKRVRLVFIGLGLASILARWGSLYRNGLNFDLASYMTNLKFPTWTHCDSFWFGCVFAEIFRHRPTPSARESGLALMGAAVVAASYFYYVNLFDPYFQITIPVWGAFFTALLLWGLPAIDVRHLRRTGLVDLGYISYSLYLIHKICIRHFLDASRAQAWIPARSPWELLGAFAFTLVVGLVFFFVLERPVLKLLKNPYFRPREISRAS